MSKNKKRNLVLLGSIVAATTMILGGQLILDALSQQAIVVAIASVGIGVLLVAVGGWALLYLGDL